MYYLEDIQFLVNHAYISCQKQLFLVNLQKIVQELGDFTNVAWLGKS